MSVSRAAPPTAPAPAAPYAAPDAGDAAWLAPFLRRYSRVSTEAVAARRSRELQAILGRVLIEMQDEGEVMVTPAAPYAAPFHLTAASRE